MFQICPKCAYVRKLDDTMSSDSCPGCGMLYSKYLDATSHDSTISRARTQAQKRSKASYLKVLLVVFLIVGLVYRFYHRTDSTRQFNTKPPPVLAAARSSVTVREFADLFNADITFASLATPDQYTIIEVYLDQCTYCRELEAALVPLQAKRNDINLIRVHHPGQISNNLKAGSRVELEATMKVMNARMNSYQLCATPHVEVYGPDKKALGTDTCKNGAGTTFLWNWITAETGIVRRSAANSVSPMF